MSSGASLRPDICERREIIAEHQWSDSRVLECLRPSGSPLSEQSVVFLPWPAHHAGYASSCARPRTFFHTLPPPVECRVVELGRKLSNSHTIERTFPSAR